MLEVRLLGQFDIRLDGEPVEIRSRPAQSLFAYLISNPGVDHRREKLAGFFWPESNEINARNNLRQALWRIRKVLRDGGLVGEDLIQADSIHITFNPDTETWLDVSVLEADVSEGAPVESLQEAVSLYEGEFLPGFYEDWVLLTRERLQAIFEHKMQQLLELFIKEARWHDVLEWGERWVSLGQSPELAFRALMIAHGGLGDTSGVASIYQRCVETLMKEMEVEPSEDTKQAYELLSAGEKLHRLHPEGWGEELVTTPLAPSEFAIPAFLEAELPSLEKAPPVFVARERELERLDRFMQESLDGRGKVAFIIGEAGSGKTALMDAFAKRAQSADTDLVVTMGDCDALTGIGDPYLPFREALALLLGDLEPRWAGGSISRDQAQRLWANAPHAFQVLIKEAPDLVDGFLSTETLLSRLRAFSGGSNEWVSSMEALLERKRSKAVRQTFVQKDLFRQYSQLYLALAQRTPILLLLDDLQWADPGSIGLLAHLGRSLEGSRILVLGAFRPSEITPGAEGQRHPLAKVAGEFKRTFGSNRIELGVSDDDETFHFVEAFLDSEPNNLDQDFREALFRHTNGNPLFTVELLRSMEARGDIVKDDGGRWVESAALDWESLPPRIEGVIEERIGRLGEEAQEVLTVASVEGEEFTAEVVAQVMGIESREVIALLSSELDKHHRLVFAQGTRRVGKGRISLYRFRHILFEKHIYSQLDDVERAQFHEDIGIALEGIYAERLGETSVQLARHFAAAGITEKAIHYLTIAGERAKRLSANEEAISHLSRAIALLQELPSTAEVAQEELALQVSLGVPLIATKGYAAPEVERTFARARDLSLLVLDPPKVFPVMYGLRTYYLARAEHSTAKEIAEQLYALAENEEDPALMLEASEAVGSTLFYIGDLVQAQEYLKQGFELYDPEVHHAHAFLYGQDPGVACLSYLALTELTLGYFVQSEEKSRQAIALARKQAHPFSLALSLTFAALFHAVRREAYLAREFATEAIAISTKHSFPVWLAAGTILHGWAMTDSGEIEDGLARMRQGLEGWRATGSTVGRPHFLAVMAEALGDAGKVEEGQRLIDEALRTVGESGERVNEAELCRIEAELLWRSGGSMEQVETLLLEALDFSREQAAKIVELRATMSLCRLWREMGRHEEARELLHEVYSWFEEGMGTVDLMQARGLLETGD